MEQERKHFRDKTEPIIINYSVCLLLSTLPEFKCISYNLLLVSITNRACQDVYRSVYARLGRGADAADRNVDWDCPTFGQIIIPNQNSGTTSARVRTPRLDLTACAGILSVIQTEV